jgi:hypothetical protein
VAVGRDGATRASGACPSVGLEAHTAAAPCQAVGMADDRDEGMASSIMRDQYLYLVITGVVAIVYGTLHAEQRVLGYVAGGLFIVVGGILLRWSLRRKRRRGGR